MDDLTLTPRITHDRGLWATAALGALTALVTLTLGAGFDMAGASHWPVLDDITHAAGWTALAVGLTALIRSVLRAVAEHGARTEAHIQSVREEMRAGRTEIERQAKEITALQEAVAAIPDLVAARVQKVVDEMEDRLSDDFVTKSENAVHEITAQANVRALPAARRQ
jgi:hypothetical protein